MMRAHLDVILSSGHFEGWAYDEDRPLTPVLVSIRAQSNELAYGLAYRFRDDLVKAAIGTGFCAFRLKTNAPVSRVRHQPLDVFERDSDTLIFSTPSIRYIEGVEEPIDSIEKLSAHDCSIIESVHQLVGCEMVFARFILLRGVDAFVRTVYVYVLGRPADPDGVALYGRLLRQSLLSPITMIQTLAESSEFKARPRALAAPIMPGFPFRCD